MIKARRTIPDSSDPPVLPANLAGRVDRNNHMIVWFFEMGLRCGAETLSFIVRPARHTP